MIYCFMTQNTPDHEGKVIEDELCSLMLCDLHDPKGEHRNYRRVHNLHQLRQVVESHQGEFNNISKVPMSLVLFRFAFKHISLILKQPSGHALLVVVDRSEPSLSDPTACLHG